VLNAYLRFIGDVEDRLPACGFTDVVRSPWGHLDLLAVRDNRRWGFNCRPGELSATNVGDIGGHVLSAITKDPAFGNQVLILVCDRPQSNSAQVAAKGGRIRIVVFDKGFEQAMREIVM